MCLEKYPLGFLNNLKQLEPIFVIFGNSILICMISHLTLVVLLPYPRIH